MGSEPAEKITHNKLQLRVLKCLKIIRSSLLTCDFI
jgi:hypothetical protein